MPLVGVKANAGAFGLGWSAVSPAEELGGMVLLTPTSVDITGGGSETATTNPNGSVEFTACGTVSLNGVFSADYDNYMVTIRHVGSATGGLAFRLRASGTDNSTANSYVYQVLGYNNTTQTAARTTTDLGVIGSTDTAQRSGDTSYVYGPYLAQPTAWRTVNIRALNSATIFDYANTHNQSTSYDGFTFYPVTGDISGLISVYGLVGA